MVSLTNQAAALVTLPFERSARFAELFHRHAPFVGRSLRRLGLHRQDVEDAVQEVFLVANAKLERIDPEKERSFLYGVTLRVAARARSKSHRSQEELGKDTDAADTPRADCQPSASEALERQHARGLLEEVLGAMSLELRAVFTLYELEGLNGQEIAALLGVRHGTVRTRLHRARQIFSEETARLRARELGVRKGERR